MTSRANLAALLLVAGLALLAGSWLWLQMAGSRQPWTERDAKAYSDAAANLHALRHQVGQAEQRRALQRSTALNEGTGADSSRGGALDYPPSKDDLAVAEERYRTLNRKLDDARSTGQTPTAILRWTGIAVIVLGVFAYATSRPPAA